MIADIVANSLWLQLF